MMLPIKYFAPMIVAAFGGVSAAVRFSEHDYPSIGSAKVVSISELPFPGIEQ